MLQFISNLKKTIWGDAKNSDESSSANSDSSDNDNIVIEANPAGFSGSSDSQTDEQYQVQFIPVLAVHFDNLHVNDGRLKINTDPHRAISKRRMTI